MPIRILLAALLAVLVTACGGGGITAENCDDIADETMGLFQRLIDSVDDEFGELTVEEFIAAGTDLPSLQEFREDSETIDTLALELGCTQSQISGAVDARVGELEASTELGQFIIDAIRVGGI